MGQSDPVFEAQVIELYRERELSAGEIAKILPVRPSTVYSMLVRNNVPRRPKGGRKRSWRISADDRRLTRHLYQDQKMSLREIADIMGVKPTTVHNRLIRWGIKRRPRSVAIKVALAKRTPEERRALAKKSYAALTPEQRENFQTRGGRRVKSK